MLQIIEYPTDPERLLPVKNAEIADATAVFAVNFWTPPMRVLKRNLEPKYCPISIAAPSDGIELSPVELNIARVLYRFCDVNNVERLNVAGNSLKTLVGENISQTQTSVLLFKVLRKVHEHRPLKALVCTGDLGLGIAAAAATVALEIPLTVAMPKGYLQRDIEGIFRPHTKDQIANLIIMCAGGLRTFSGLPPLQVEAMA